MPDHCGDALKLPIVAEIVWAEGRSLDFRLGFVDS